MTLEINKMLTISTGHISLETADRISAGDDDLPWILNWSEYGWLVLCHDITGDDLDFPQDLQRCMDFARSRDCEWLRLDMDGDQIDELPVFDWQQERAEE